ncbi:MMPL family transporter [Aeromicrobium sp. Root236]|uniref:MMPL family transporter n=1 Tax=Aeromicrobium sp. Root236 TaxID=1736498 RepID=UPI001F22B6AE|nr:MMPL family transporter [Aeromicrobium sp. Root236]
MTRNAWWVVLGWIVFAVVVAVFSPKLTSTTDNSEFLPGHYESIKALNLQDKAFPSQTSTGAILVFEREDGGKLTAADSADVESVSKALDGKLDKAFTGVAVQPPSDNKLVQIAAVGLDKSASGFDSQSMDAVKDLRSDVKTLLKDTDLRAGVTGNAAQSLDSQDASEKTLSLVLIATILLIVIFLALVFRSVIICLLPIVTVAVVSTVATGLIGTANKIFDLKADNSIQAILVVVLFGIGTDYILFLLFRYRERLRSGEEPKVAMVNAMERAGEAIASAGGAVIVSFMALVLSSLSIFRSIGPALAIAVAVTLVAALTLVPAVVSLLGRALFWPSKSWKTEREGARFTAVGKALGAHPLRFALVSGAVLAALAVFSLGFKPSFDFSSSLPTDAESTVALKTLQKSLPAGSTDPIQVLVHSKDGSTIDTSDITAFGSELAKAKGVAVVSEPQISSDGTAAMFNAVLKDDPGSDKAISNVRGPIRDLVHTSAPSGTEALVGGSTSVTVDMDNAMARDYSIVFPVAALVILLILALLLRSLVAPLYLMASVGLGFGATLGAAVILFQHIQNENGLIFLLPIYIYLFVVALGTDYNILMIARLREEAREGRSPRDAAAEAVRHAGPTIAAAGVILAGSFATFMLGGNALITSMGFALSFGIFVAAFVMAMFFTPALTALIGHAAWWPGHGDETAEEKAVRVDVRG